MKNYIEVIKFKYNMLFFLNEILVVDNLLINEYVFVEYQDGWNGRFFICVILVVYIYIIKDRIIMYFVMKQWYKIFGYIYYCVFSLLFFW